MTPTKPKTVKHKCIQVKKIQDVYDIITGDGTPEDGMLFQLALLKSGQGTVLKKLEDINSSIKELHDKYEASIKLAQSVKNAFGEYKKEVTGFEKGEDHVIKTQDKKKSERRERLRSVLQTMLAVIAAIGLVLTAYFGFKTHKETAKIDGINTKVDDLGTPVLTRGNNVIELPPEFKIKFWPYDFDTKNDTIKK